MKLLGKRSTASTTAGGEAPPKRVGENNQVEAGNVLQQVVIPNKLKPRMQLIELPKFPGNETDYISPQKICFVLKIV